MTHIGTTRLRLAAAVLTVAVALSQPIAAQAAHGGGGSHGGGGFHGGGFHGGFHSSGFHGGFNHGNFSHGNFGDNHFDHGRDRGFDGWWWGGFASPYFDGDDVYDVTPSPTYTGQYWYCQNPAGYYPYVTSCSTGWQPAPAG